jgi:hypothetical protein
MSHQQLSPLNQLGEILDRLSNSGLIGIKSELESEGIRFSELNTLNLLARAKRLKTALKIGGAEAKSDLMLAFEQLTDYVIVPMIETEYAAHKCVNLFRELHHCSSLHPPSLLINIETKTAFENLSAIIEVAKPTITGVVFGRVDFTLSSGLSRSEVLSSHVSEAAFTVSRACREHELEFVLGGGVSVDSIDLLKQLTDIRLDRFETRKCILSSSSLFSPHIYQLLKDCVLAELLWLKLKSATYLQFSREDAARIEMLEKRHLYNISSFS